MNAQLAPVMDESGIAAYTATEQGLAELRARLTGRVYDVTTGNGTPRNNAPKPQRRDPEFDEPFKDDDIPFATNRGMY